MKKSLILGLLGLAATVVPSFGQGVILLDNYQTSGPLVTYGANVPANGLSGAVGSGGLNSSFTMGLYYVIGSPVIGADPNANPIGDPSTFAGGLVLGTGNGSSAQFQTTAFGSVGLAHSGAVFAIPGTSATGGDTVTVEIIAYSGASYANAGYRGHSTAFTLTTAANNSVTPTLTGSKQPAFSVFAAVPEPSVFALAGLSGAFLMLIRRKK